MSKDYIKQEKKLHDVNNIYFQTQIHFQTPDLKKIPTKKQKSRTPNTINLTKLIHSWIEQLRLYLQNLSISNIETILKQTY